MIIRIAGADDECVAVQVSENREADSGGSEGFDVRSSWRMAVRTFALAGAAPVSTILSRSSISSWSVFIKIGVCGLTSLLSKRAAKGA